MIRLPIWLLLFFPAFIYASEKVVIFNWSEYMPEKVIELFERETGIQVEYITYDSNESMLQQLKAKSKSYDVIFPSTYYVHRMIKEALIQYMDTQKLHNFKNIHPQFLNKSYDPGNKFSVPYLWGTTSIIQNKELIPQTLISGYKDLWSEGLQLILMDDMRELFGISLKALGYSINETNPQRIREAYEHLKLLIPKIKYLASENFSDPIINREVNAGLLWNGDAFTASEAAKQLEYIYPEEGVIIWQDSMVIPRNASNLENAYKFIDFLLRPEISKILCEELGYATPNLQAFSLLDENTRKNRIIFPPKEIQDKGEYMLDVGPALQFYQKYWDEFITEYTNSASS